MGYIQKRIVLIALMIVGVFSFLTGCGDNKYKDLKLDVSSSEMEIVLDEENPQNNLFSITATVSKMPKGYDGSVTFSMPVNDFISVVDDNPTVKDGESTAVYEAKKQGGPIKITVRTTEGNLYKEVLVKVVKPITSISFTQNVIPIVKGVRTDISEFLKFNPDGTNQDGIKLELSPATASDDLIKVVTDGKYLTVPADVNLVDFKIQARSTVNEKIVSNQVEAKVLSIIPVEQIKLMFDNNTPDNRDDDTEVEKGNGNKYSIVLATNTSDYYLKTVYFNFNDVLNENENYIVEVEGREEGGIIVDENGVVDHVLEVRDTLAKTNSFDLNAIGNGNTEITFIIKRADFPDYKPFEQRLTLNVKVEAFPKYIKVTNGQDDQPLNKITLYSNYNEAANIYGTRFRIEVLNDTGLMTNQDVIASVSIGADNILLYDRFKTRIPFGEETPAGFDYYLAHNFKSVPSEKIKLTLISASYNKVQFEIPIEIEAEPLVLSTSKPTVNVDVVKPDEGTNLAIEGISASYDLTRLKVDLVKNETTDATKLVRFTQERTQIKIYPLGEIGECYINVTAENGSQVIFKIVLFESLNLEETYVTIAGEQVMASDTAGGPSRTVKIKNGLNVPIYYTINGKKYPTLVGTGLNYEVKSSSPNVVRYLNVVTLQTQNMAGVSTISITVVGYNEEGVQNKAVYFAINIEVTIPLTSLSVMAPEKEMYDINSLSYTQYAQYGEHNILLVSAPSNASFKGDDIVWVVEYNGMEVAPGTVIGTYNTIAEGNKVIHEISPIETLLITIETSTDNFKWAKVSCRFDGASIDREVFSVTAKINQEFYNENGILIPSPKSASTRFIVTRAEKVSDFLFDNIPGKYIKNEIYYDLACDERDLGFDGVSYTENNTFAIPFTVYPATALNKDLTASSNNAAVEVTVNNVSSKIYVKLKSKISSSSSVIIKVQSIDSIATDEEIYKQIQVRILDGTVANPFEIKTEEDLRKINTSLNAHYVLANNIYISQSKSWLPIGYTYGGVNNDELILRQFNGTISGKNVIKFGEQVLQTNYFSINGFKIENNNLDYYGLFAYLGSNSVVSDLNINDFVIKANITRRETHLYAGGLAGYASGAIYNVGINDNSGVASFDGTYYENVKRGITNFTNGIYITSSTNTNQKAYYFIGGMVGFLNHPTLSTGTFPLVRTARIETVEENIAWTSRGGEDVGLRMYVYDEESDFTVPVVGEILNSTASVQINSYAGANNVEYVGGLVGFNNKGIIQNQVEQTMSTAANSSDVISVINASVALEESIHNYNSAFGGIVGFNNGIIQFMSAKASIFGEYDSNVEQYYMSNMGGIVGYNAGTVKGTESFPLLRGYYNVGGSIGKTESSVVYIKNHIGEDYYEFAYGIYPADDHLLTFDQSLEFNATFTIDITKFETVVFDYYQLYDFLSTEIYEGQAETVIDEKIKEMYGIDPAMIKNSQGYDVREDFALIKITSLDLLRNDIKKEKYITCYNSEEFIQYDFYGQFDTSTLLFGLAVTGVNQVESNSVKFLDTNDIIVEYNTAIIGYQNVGGVMGEATGLVGNTNDNDNPAYELQPHVDYYVKDNPSTPLVTTSSYELNNPFMFNTAFSYVDDKLRPINEVGYSEGFYGNILLADSHGEGAAEDIRNYAGGIIGKMSSGAIVNSQATAVIQGKLSGIGGIVGKAEGIVKINDCLFVGTLYNKDNTSDPTVTCATGGIVGDALDAATTFAYVAEEYGGQLVFRYAPSQISVKGVFVYKEPYWGGTLVTYSEDIGHNNIENCYFIANTPSGFITSNPTNGRYDLSNGYVGEGLKTIKLAYFKPNGTNNLPVDLNNAPDITEYYKEVEVDILKVNQTDVMSDKNMVARQLTETSAAFTDTIDVGQLDKFMQDAGTYAIPNEYEPDPLDPSQTIMVDSNGDGIKDVDSGLDYSTDIYYIFRTLLDGLVWYQNYQLNGQLPVLLSRSKVVPYGEGYRIDVLASYPPTDINIRYVQNGVNTFIAEMDTKQTGIIYHYGLGKDSYNADKSKINFGVELNETAQTFYTDDLNAQLTELNTYRIEDILSVQSIPSFVKSNDFIIASSDTSKLSIEYDSNNDVYFLAKAAGVVRVTFTSVYDTNISKTVAINVVNATQNMELSYYSGNDERVIKYNSTVRVNKSTGNNVISLPVYSKLNSQYRYVSGDRIDKTFNLLDNPNGGIRYYYLSNEANDGTKNYNSIFHSAEPDEVLANINIQINEQQFSYQQIGTKYVFYIDVPYGNETNIVGTDERLLGYDSQLLAVPYITGSDLSNNQFNRPLVQIGDEDSFITIDYNNEGVEEQDKIYGIYSTGDEYLAVAQNILTKFTVRVNEANWSVTPSHDSLSFDVFESPTFFIDVETDKQLADSDLYLAYYDMYNQERVVAVSTLIDHINYGFGSEITIGNLTIQVNTIKEYTENGQTHISYSFEVLVKTANQLNVQDSFSRTIRFFVAKDDVVITTNAEGYILNPISNIAESKMMVSLPITVNPQEIKEITLKHYPNSESVITTNSNGVLITEINLNEIAYDNIIPGYVGMLKAYVSPYFASFDRLEIISQRVGSNIIQLEQMLAVVEETEFGVIYTGRYQTLVIDGVSIVDGISLSKQSYINQYGEIVYDGNVYIKTLVTTFIEDAKSFDLTINAYKNNVLKKSTGITLAVQAPPSLVLSVNGDKIAPIARGTELELNAKVADNIPIDFTGSYIYAIENGIEVKKYDYGFLFNINSVNNRHFVVTDYRLSTKLYIKVIGKVTKTINGETVTHTDSVDLKVADFVIESITVDRVVNGNITGYFNQPYALIVKVEKATYNSKLSVIVKEQIAKLEKEFSKVNENHSGGIYDSEAGFDGNELLVWRTVNQAYSKNDKKRYGGIHFEGQTSDSYKIGTAAVTDFGDEAVRVYTLQNTRFGSPDKLAAAVQFLYLDDQIIALNTADLINQYSQYSYRYEKVFEFGFNFYRVRDEERPDPIETAEQFKLMEDGVDYILVNDITLTDWEPFRDDLKINSLDGNGYVITIESFKLDNYQSGMELIENKNIGIFSRINPGTIIKNLIIEVRPKLNSATTELSTYDSTNVDLLVDARAYKNVNFGLLAAENAGIVTNVQVVRNAGQHKLERDVIIARQNPEDYLDQHGNYNDKNVYDNNQGKYAYDGWKYDNGKIVSTDAERDLSVVRVETTSTLEAQTHYMAGLIAKNTSGVDEMELPTSGYITNSTIDDITINGVGYVAGFVVENVGKISSSYYKGGNIINRVAEGYAKAATSGFVIFNKGETAEIQYSYVQGRLGNGSKHTGQTLVGGSSIQDKTGLINDVKKAFAGVEFSNHTAGERNESALNYIAELRALNSLINTKTLASAFVYENEGVISNTYANIMVNSTMRTSGFVFHNKATGTISSSYTLSSIKLNERDASPFVGRSETHTYNNDNPIGLTDVHYLKIGSDANSNDYEVRYAEDFSDADEPATALGSSDFAEYNTFQGYAFNTDFEINSEEKVTRAVWFMPSSSSVSIYDDNFKANHYARRRPELVAANLKTQSIRVWTGTDTSGENSYIYASETIGTSIKNPILIKTAEDFNRYLCYESNIDGTGRNFAIRFVSDITFNKTDLTAQTYNIDYFGDLDGNGMAINELRLVSDTDFETEDGSTITHLGLFGRIITQPLDTEGEQRGVVRNLNINVAEVRGTKVTYVGALAGSIENADVFNINVSGDEIIQGRNVVGGLVGIVLGDSELVNISSSVSAKAAYFKETNGFSTKNPTLSNYGSFDLYFDIVEETGTGDDKVTTKTIMNESTISYVGGVAGVIDVDKRSGTGLNPLSLFNAKTRKLTVDGSITLIGEVVGGIVGLNGRDSTISDIGFTVVENETPHLKASRAAGGILGENRGEVERSYIQHNSVLQKKIDKEYENAVNTTSINPKVYSSTSNYNDLLTGNAHYIGGLVGINNGGSLENCYSRVNVINENSMYAGGIIGASIGGTYSFCYTTGSVSGFRSAGGFVGIELESKNLFDETSVTTEVKVYSLPVKNIHGEYVFFSMMTDGTRDEAGAFKNANIVNAEGSQYSGIVAANIWRREDLNNDRIAKYNNANLANLKLGSFIGVAVIVNHNAGSPYNVATLTGVTSASSSDRLKLETNFFNMVKITGNEIPTADGADYIPEIGAIGNTYGNQLDDLDIQDDTRESTGSSVFKYSGVEYIIGQTVNNVGLEEVSSGVINSMTSLSVNARTEPRYTGISGYFAQREQDATTKAYYVSFYRYSRLQNIGSGRTMKEIVTELNILDDEESETDAFGKYRVLLNNPSFTEATTVPFTGYITGAESVSIYENWDSNRWTGIRKETDADQATVFPYLEAKPFQTVIYVYNADQLKQMGTYVNAEFVLMDDIDLQAGANAGKVWEPVGSSAVPFRGILHSNPDAGRNYTISNLVIDGSTSSYLGLVGYAIEAKFYDFNLYDVEITTNPGDSKAFFVGSVVGYSSAGTTIDNVHVGLYEEVTASGSTIHKDTTLTYDLNNVASVGGLVGYSGSSSIKDSTVIKPTITINSFANLAYISSMTDKAYAFGGVAGMMTGQNSETPLLYNVTVDTARITIKNKNAATPLAISKGILSSATDLTIDVGGLVGRVNNQKQQTFEIAKIAATNTSVCFDVNINFADDVTAVSSINIGGMVGNGYAAIIADQLTADDNTYSIANTVESIPTADPANPVELNYIMVSNFDKEINYGGAAGVLYGITKTEVVGAAATSSYDVSNVLVGNKKQIKTIIKTSTMRGSELEPFTQNVGGAIGKAVNAAIYGLYVNADIINNSVSKYGFISTGGLIGDAYNCQSISNGYANGVTTTRIIDTNTSGATVSTGEAHTSNIATGGAFGRLAMANNGTAKVEKIVSSVKVVLDHTRTVANTSAAYVGGLVGVVYSGNIDQSAAYGDIEINNAARFNELYVGGFVGRIHLNAAALESGSSKVYDTNAYNFVVGFLNEISITNSYTVSDMSGQELFTSATAKHRAGLFVGEIYYNNTYGTFLILRNNYTIGKFIYTYGTTFKDKLYEEKVNKGGFLGGYTFAAAGITLNNIENATNLLFLNNIYNADFIPYSNDLFEGSNTYDMLFDNNSELSNNLHGDSDSKLNLDDTSEVGFNKDNVWKLETTFASYPKLAWIENSAGDMKTIVGTDYFYDLIAFKNVSKNSIVGKSATGLQSAASKVRPATAGTEGVENGAYIVDATKASYTDLFKDGTTIYFDTTLGVSSINVSINNKSLVYGLKYTGTASAFTTNNGLIVNAHTKGSLVETNNAVVYQVTVANNATGSLVNKNNGAVDSVVVNKANTLSSITSAADGSGYLYRVGVRNNTTTLGTTKAKSSYVTSSASGVISGTYYDAQAGSRTFEIYNTSPKFDIEDLNNSILTIDAFDFAHDWVFIDSTTADLNYGAPILRYELYGLDGERVDFDGEILNTYKWSNYLSKSESEGFISKFGGAPNIEITDDPTDTEDGAVLLAQIASMTSYGYIVPNSEKATISNPTAEALFVDSTKTSPQANGSTILELKDYKFGVLYSKQTINMDFRDKTIKVSADIDLSGKLWTPIGFGLDGEEVLYNEYYSYNIAPNESMGLINTFKGSFDADGNFIKNVTSIEVNKNVGLFGAVEIYQSHTNGVVRELVISDSNFVSIATNGGYAVSGAVIGRAILSYGNLNEADIPITITQIGTQNANVYATNIASGLIGQYINAYTSNKPENDTDRALTVKIQYSYVNSNVSSVKDTNNFTSAFAHMGNNVYYGGGQILASNKYIDSIRELYVAGELSYYEKGATAYTTVKPVSKDSNIGLFGNLKTTTTVDNSTNNLLNSIYALGFTDNTVMLESIRTVDDNRLKTEALEHFTWGKEWERLDGQNDNYPVLNSETTYWVQNESTAITPSLETYDGQMRYVYKITSAPQLAWIATQTHAGEKFDGDVIKLMNDIDLDRHIWSPIGYNSTYPFQGIFDFNGKKVSNIMTSGTYVERNDGTVEYKEHDNVGLIGYATGATITSSTGIGRIGKDSDSDSLIVSTRNIGALVGYAIDTTITNIENDVTVTSSVDVEVADASQYGAGGLIGKYEARVNSKIDNLVNTGYLNILRDNAGGIVGLVVGSADLTITKARNTGDIYAPKYNKIGGIVGCDKVGVLLNGLGNWTTGAGGTYSTADGAVLSNTTKTPDNLGTITGKDYVGGIIGYGAGSAIEAVTNGGNIYGVNMVGGIIGNIDASVSGGASVYETINTGEIGPNGAVNITNAGSIVGKITSVKDAKIANMLNKKGLADTTISSATNNGALIGGIADTGLNEKDIKIFAGVDIAGTHAKTLAFGDHNNLFKKKGIMSSAKVSDVLNSQTEISYGPSDPVKFDQVFSQSLVWKSVANGVTSETIQLDYRIQPNPDNAPESEATIAHGVKGYYLIDESENINYLNELNRKRYGVSCLIDNYGIKFARDFKDEGALVNILNLGYGAYPWRTLIEGDDRTVQVASFNGSSNTKSLFGAVFGNRGSEVPILNLNVKYTAGDIVTDSGLLMKYGSYVELNNVNIVSKGSDVNASGTYGAIAKQLTYSEVTDCTSEQSVSLTSASVVGGLVSNAVDTVFENCAVNADVKVDVADAIAGGLVGTASSSNKSDYEFKDCRFSHSGEGSQERDAQYDVTIMTKGITGGIAGKSAGYTFDGCRVGQQFTNDAGLFDGRSGFVKGKNIGGVVGESSNDLIKNCITTTNIGVSSDTTSAGGLVYKTTNNTSIENSTSRSVVRGVNAGGFVAELNNATIKGSKNEEMSESIGSSYAGGFAAIMKSSTINNCEHYGYAAGTSLTENSSPYVGGIAAYAENSVISSCKIDGYAGVYYDDGGPATTGGYKVNRYYSRINIDDEDYNDKTCSYDSTGEKGRYDTTKYGNFNIARVITSSSNTTITSNSVVAPTEEKTVVVNDYYVSVSASNNGKWLWARVYYVTIKAYVCTGQPGDTGQFAVSTTSSYIDETSESKKANFWGSLENPSALKTSLQYTSEPDKVFPANSNAKSYYIRYKDTKFGINISNERKLYEGDKIVLPKASHTHNEVSWAVSSWKSELMNNVDSSITMDDDALERLGYIEEDGKKIVELTAIWEEGKIYISLYGAHRNSTEEIGAIPIKDGGNIADFTFASYDGYNEFKDNLKMDGYKISEWYSVSPENWNQLLDQADGSLVSEDAINARNALQALLGLDISDYNMKGRIDDGDYTKVSTYTVDDKGVSISLYNPNSGKGYSTTKVTTSTTFNEPSDIYAIWIKTWKVNFYKSETEKHGQPQIVDNNGKAARPANPTKEHYNFVDWYVGTYDTTYSKVNITTTKFDFNSTITKDIYVIAKWEPIKYNVEFKYTIGDTDALNKTDTILVEYNNKIPSASIPDPNQRIGYEFDGWLYRDPTDGQMKTFDINSKVITGNITLSASYKIRQFDVVFFANGAALEPSSTYSKTVNYGEFISSVPEPNIYGYTFEGWYTKDGTGGDWGEEFKFAGDVNATPIEDDMNVYAKLKAAEYTITYYDAENGSEVGTTIVEHGQTADRPTTIVKDGYRIVDFYSNDACQESDRFDFENTPIINNVSIYVKFVKEFTITFVIPANYTSSGNIKTEEVKADIDTVIDAADIPKANSFMASGKPALLKNSGWKLYDGTIAADYTDLSEYTITEDVTFYFYGEIEVIFKQNITSIDPSIFDNYFSVFVEYNTPLEVPDTEPVMDGYGFKGYYKEQSFTTSFDFSAKLNTATNVYIKFIPEKTVTLMVNNVPKYIKVVQGDKIVVVDNGDGTANVMNGASVACSYTIAAQDWYDSEDNVIDINNYVVNEDVTLYLDSKKLTVTYVYCLDRAQVHSVEEVVTYGTELVRPPALKEVEANGVIYQSYDYYVDDTFNGMFAFGEITSDTTIYVDVEKFKVKVTFYKNEGTSTVPNWTVHSSSGFVQVGSKVTLPDDIPANYAGTYTSATKFDETTAFDFGTVISDKLDLYMQIS